MSYLRFFIFTNKNNLHATYMETVIFCSCWN